MPKERLVILKRAQPYLNEISAVLGKVANWRPD
jgi:hypothetical protein